MEDTDNLKAHARKWEERAKANRAEVQQLRHELEVAKAKERSWRDAYHSLRLSVEDRLDRVTAALADWEAADD